MRIVFMGTPDFAVPSLRALARVHEVELVVTGPDAVRGRGKKLVPSAVRSAAEADGLSVLCASRVTPEVLVSVGALSPDVIVVAAYGALLPDELLAIPTLDCINVHASLLPRWRGAAPIQRAILAGDTAVGVSIMRMVHELDRGPYCRQAAVVVADKDAAALTEELAELGAKELLAALDDVSCGKAVWTEQDEQAVTYAQKVAKSEMYLAPTDAATTNMRRVQASSDAAPARCSVGRRGVRILSARAVGCDVHDGAVVRERGRVLLGCCDGALELVRVRPEGKRDMDGAAWASGLRDGDLTWSAVAAPTAAVGTDQATLHP